MNRYPASRFFKIMMVTKWYHQHIYQAWGWRKKLVVKMIRFLLLSVWTLFHIGDVSTNPHTYFPKYSKNTQAQPALFYMLIKVSPRHPVKRLVWYWYGKIYTFGREMIETKSSENLLPSLVGDIPYRTKFRRTIGPSDKIFDTKPIFQ